MGMLLYVMDDATHLIAEVEDREGNDLDPIRDHLGIACVVRRWGTTKGRGELAIDGPTHDTIADMEPPGGVVSWLHVRRVLKVQPKARERWLKLMTELMEGYNG